MENSVNTGFKPFNSNHLKLIAIVAMTVDHLTWLLFPGYQTKWYVLLLHIFGRLTAPIMWFFIAEGFHYTRDARKYALRLFIFAVISHFAYNFCSGHSFIPFKDSFFNQTSVIWALLGGLLLLMVCTKDNISPLIKILFIALVCVLTFPADWSCIAAVAIFFMGSYYGNFKKQMIWMMVMTACYAIVYFFCIDRIYGILQLFTGLSIPVLRLYNGKRGNWKGMKWLFYIYYPLHLVIIGILRLHQAM